MRYFNGYIKGQSTLEYAVLIISVALALAAMQVYARRAISGNLRERADRIAQSYEPGKVTADVTTKLTKEVDTETTVLQYDPTDPGTWPKDPETGEPVEIAGIEIGEVEDVTITDTEVTEKTERWGEESVAEPGTDLF